MDLTVPNFISYDRLLESLCTRNVAGMANDDIEYLVQLAEELVKLARETDDLAEAHS